MKFHRIPAVSLMILLGACDSTGGRSAGIEATIKATPIGAAHAHQQQAGTGRASGASSTDSSHVSFRRGDGVKIDLQLGLVNLVPVELQRCDRLAGWLRRGFAPLNPLPSAWAHSGHAGEAPEGAVSIVGTHQTRLGTLVAAPGRYCAIVVDLQPGTATAKHGGELDTSLDGVAINVAPCYYPTTAGLSDEDAAAVSAHTCIQAKAQRVTRRITLPFAAVVLDAANPDLNVTIATHYEEWFEQIDFATLAADGAQQALLADNLVGSLQSWTDREQQTAP